jgi:hypothetical protein
VKFRISRHVLLRVQVRDYISQPPHQVIVPLPGVALKGLRQDVIGTAAVALTW